MAVNHFMACQLEFEDQRQRLENQDPQFRIDFEEKHRKDFIKLTENIRSAFWSSFGIILVVATMALFAGYNFDRINIELLIDFNKVTTFSGSSLIAWATLMILGGDIPFWDGGTFPHLVQTVLFKTIFVPGVFLVLLSILM